jgi:hypothetical protein
LGSSQNSFRTFPLRLDRPFDAELSVAMAITLQNQVYGQGYHTVRTQASPTRSTAAYRFAYTRFRVGVRTSEPAALPSTEARIPGWAPDSRRDVVPPEPLQPPEGGDTQGGTGGEQ